MGNYKLKVAVAMSGGVDSSVAAFLVQQKGYQVSGITMKIWEGEAVIGKHAHHGCYGPEEEADIDDARRVAEHLGIPLEVIDLTREYKHEVLDYFCQEYTSGRTPNPCVRCNQRVKFGALIDKAAGAGMDFDFVASGHYARIELDSSCGRYQLKKAADLSKDQSYFLSFLSQQQLGRLIFPLGSFSKVQVREIARSCGLEVANKPDSQNFIAGDYTSVIKIETKPGPITDQQGKVLGQHQGIHNYTIGQRKGLEITTPEPAYVTAINADSNTLVVGSQSAVYQSVCTVNEVNWIALPVLDTAVVAKVKIRSSQPAASAKIIPLTDHSVQVIFSQPQLAISPGQTAVFYQEDLVLGGGTIQKHSL